jgi:DNA-binding XRE family transcriptional regulator
MYRTRARIRNANHIGRGNEHGLPAQGLSLRANTVAPTAWFGDDVVMAEVIRIRPSRPEPDPLWREVLGRRLRATREDQGRRLVDVAERAGISPQYLSEIERGRKEPSSEMIAAVCGALGLNLIRLVGGVSADLSRDGTRRSSGPVLLAA